MPIYPTNPTPTSNSLFAEFSNGDLLFDIRPEDDIIEAHKGLGRVVMNGVVANTAPVSDAVDFIWVPWENELIGVPDNAAS